MTGSARRVTGWSLLVLAGGLLFAGVASAQSTIPGRVLDADGNAVPGIEVLLHAISESTGNEVDRDTSRSDGAFDVSVADVDANAVYFVAVMHGGQLYIGDLLRPPFPSDHEYVVRVGVDPIDFSAGAATTPFTPQPDQGGRTAGLVVVIVSVGVIGAVMIFVMRRRPPAQRRWLVELARLEEELAATQEPDEALRARRSALRDRLQGRRSG